MCAHIYIYVWIWVIYADLRTMKEIEIARLQSSIYEDPARYKCPSLIQSIVFGTFSLSTQAL